MPRQSQFMQVSEEEAAALDTLIKALDVFAKKNRTMPLDYVRMLLRVMKEGGKGISDYAAEMRVNQATASRILLEVGPKARTGGHGLLLVEPHISPNDMRSKHYYLTDEGHDLRRSVTSIMGYKGDE